MWVASTFAVAAMLPLSLLRTAEGHPMVRARFASAAQDVIGHHAPLPNCLPPSHAASMPCMSS